MSLVAVADKLRGSVKGRVETDLGLAGSTTYRLGGPAALYFEPAGVDDLEAFGEALQSAGLRAADVGVLVLGRGSNVVISDRGFPGAVIRMGAGFSWIDPWDPPDAPEGSGVAAGAGTTLPQLANWAARRSLSGLEWTISIPGSVGGGVRMNAGAHGSEMQNQLVSARVWDLERSVLEDRPTPSLGFEYRRSNLTEMEVVVDASFTLTHDDESSIRERMEGFRKHRAETQPGALQNAGSVFKNPPGDSAGRLVEAAGLKGFAVGGASVSTLHANFFIAGQGATAQDVYDLVIAVRGRVADEFGVELQPEIRFVGHFRTGEGPV